MKKTSFVIISGGTGGHVIPAVNFGNYIIKKGHNCYLFLDNRGEKYASNLVQNSKKDKSIDVLGPVEAPRFLLRGQYRYRILLKGKNRKNLNKFTRQMLHLSAKPPLVKVIVDVDPYSFM